MRISKQEPEFEVNEIWRWSDWPDREELTGLDGRDFGIDLVAQTTSGEYVAIQCKCYEEKYTVRKGDVDSFLGASQQSIFKLRWMVATCNWGPNAEKAIRIANPRVTQIDFREYLDVLVEEVDAQRPVQEPWPLQFEAIDDVVSGLKNHDRGRLVMACGTGKTFTSLRISEQMVNDYGRILYVAPTIALVSQARREWLRQCTRKLRCVVVCSDSTAGGRNENEDIGLSELECPVSTDPEQIAAAIKSHFATSVVFCTYHSLNKVTQAQAKFGAPKFDLAIADEAHRTTGILGVSRSSVDFQEFHDDSRLMSHKRLYMTATPRIYTERSKGRLKTKGMDVIDMADYDVYGPQLHCLTFAKAVEHRMLSDYRVIVLGVSQSSVTAGLRNRLERLYKPVRSKGYPTDNDMTRVLGVSLAINGITEGNDIEKPGVLPRTMAFANSIDRSKWYSEALMESELLRATTRRMAKGRAMKVVSQHLDASASALQRNQALRALGNAGSTGECRVICNVKLFTEGVDVPQLDAVAFLDPRESQVDVVQAVGRVMRKAPGKRFGYIIVPVIIEPGRDVTSALEQGTEGYRTVGKVLRALQAHDNRLAESLTTFVDVYEPRESSEPGAGGGSGVKQPEESQIQRQLQLKEAEQGIFAHVAAASGLGRPGQLVADEISDAVRRASLILQSEGQEDPLAAAIDLVPEHDGGAKGICTVAALIICNACLLQRRLRNLPEMNSISRLDEVAGAGSPIEVLAVAWHSILNKDFKPIFRPALAVLSALPDRKSVNDAIRMVAECANRVADSLSDLGYDHAGPLYHRILGTATSDGAFYTNNLSAIMLARIAFSQDLVDWSNPHAVSKLRIIDPACGTGTLLMASLKTVKDRVAQENGLSYEKVIELHKRLVEDSLCGLDINQHGIQLAACNMTLGAPTVDYEQMNLVTMPHGPQSDGTHKAGSLEILAAPDGDWDLQGIGAGSQSLSTLDAIQINESSEINFPLRDIDCVIMNAPFTDNRKRSRKFGSSATKQMQARELSIRDTLSERNPAAGGVININSISTFFTPIADQLINPDRGVLAKVLPVTGCIGASGLPERKFLADRFHVERVISSHDPRRIAFSENTTIHECLLVCRRSNKQNRGPTEFISLRKMPSDAEEASRLADAILEGRLSEIGHVCQWPAQRVQAGDWSPAQWYDSDLAEFVYGVEKCADLVSSGTVLTFGPSGQAAQDSWRRIDDDQETSGIRVYGSVSADLRHTMSGEPEQLVVPGGRRAHLHENVNSGRGHLMIATRYNTVSGRSTALWSDVATFGFGWIPATGPDRDYEKALCAWWNSTLGRLLLLNRRAKTLTYPKWSIDHLKSLPCPGPDSPAIGALLAVWEDVKDTPMAPLRMASACSARKLIDSAAAIAIEMDSTELGIWRDKLAKEPTITNLRGEKL